MRPASTRSAAHGRERLDVLLVARGLAESRARAQARILAGEVVVDDQRIDKPGTVVRSDAHVRLKGDGLRWVSRGGLKLEGALQTFAVDVRDAICVDVGASTGGFTDVLLQSGARQVFAVDVGRAQLHEKLRQDPRVTSLERTHIVDMPVGTLSPAPRIAVIDTSFISLLRVLPALVPHLAPAGGDDVPAVDVIALIKPQFEVGPEHVGKGGIVRDDGARAASVERVLACARVLGFGVQGVRESPITGADGNVEYLAHFRRTAVVGG